MLKNVNNEINVVELSKMKPILTECVTQLGILQPMYYFDQNVIATVTHRCYR